MWRREPGKGRYARPERERRFLLRALPAGAVQPVAIEDRYIAGTRLRLRRLSDGTGAATYKLAQKVPDPADPSLVMTTNTYLSEEEYETLLHLPGLVLRKTRYRLPGPVAMSVDEFHGALAGLVLAEVAVEEEGPGPPVDLAGLAVTEVTDDARFTGGELAQTSSHELRQLLAGFPGTTGP